MTYKCKYCGKEFDKKQKLGGHIIHCKLNPNYENSLKQLEYARANINNYNIRHIHKNEICECQFCHKQYKLYGLKNHENSCEKNPNPIHRPYYSHSAWNKGKRLVNNESVKKQSESLKNYYKTHTVPNKGIPMSQEQKEKIRLSTLKFLKNQKGREFRPRYNKNSCSYIDDLNKKFNWNLQHAENGGEFEIDGYFIDGYDSELNIAFEYDEKRHYKDVSNNILNEKDIKRQQYIIDKLHCEFYRYNEELDKFYKVY